MPRKWFSLHDVHVEHGGADLLVHDGVSGSSLKIHGSEQVKRWPIDDLEPAFGVTGAHQNHDEDGEGVETQGDDVETLGAHSLKENQENDNCSNENL